MKMKNHMRRILAGAGALFLSGIYAATLISAFADDAHYENLLTASIYATIVVPVLLWAYTLVRRLVGKEKTEKKENDDGTEITD